MMVRPRHELRATDLVRDSENTPRLTLVLSDGKDLVDYIAHCRPVLSLAADRDSTEFTDAGMGLNND